MEVITDQAGVSCLYRSAFAAICFENTKFSRCSQPNPISNSNFTTGETYHNEIPNLKFGFCN